MDPALYLLEQGDPEDDVDVIARLDPGKPPPTGLRIVTQFDDIVTGRVARGRIREVRRDSAVISLKSSRPVTYVDDAPQDAQPPPAVHFDEGGPGARSSVVAVLDWGLDFASPTFRTPAGASRLLCLYDQRDRPEYDGHANRYGRGRIFSRDEIDAALQQPDPYDALGYHPADSDFSGGSHGTVVADIAAGNGRSGSPRSAAWNADLIFVHMGGARPGLKADHSLINNFGDTAGILEACDLVARLTEGRNCVINLSMGQMGGPHDSSTLCEIGLSRLLESRAGIAIVHSAGNYANRDAHARGELVEGRRRRLRWFIQPGDRSDNEMEIWYDGDAELGITLVSPSGLRYPLALGEYGDLNDEDGHVVGKAVHRRRDPQNHDNHWDCYLYREAETGWWQVEIDVRREPDSGPPRFWDAWIERDRGPKHQSHFHEDDVVPETTTGTIAHTPLGITVAAYDAHDADLKPATFSSIGPTRNGALKPEIAAPGVNIVAARSTPRGRSPDDARLTRKSGTSMAAPAVTGTVAAMMDAWGERMPVRTIRQILFATARPAADPAAMRNRFGHGYLDAPAAIAEAIRRAPAIAAQNAAPALSAELVTTPTGTKSIPEVATYEEQTMNDYADSDYETSHALDSDLASALAELCRSSDAGIGFDGADSLQTDAATNPSIAESTAATDMAASEIAYSYADSAMPMAMPWYGGGTIGSRAGNLARRAATATVYTVVDADARLRTGAPNFQIMGRHRIRQYTRVLVVERQSSYSRVTHVDGRDIGWTATSNLGTYFKDEITAALAPATPLAVNRGWSVRQRALANTYNRVGGMIDAVASTLGIGVPGVLGVWQIESGGRAHTPGRALIRFENHLFWRLWGQSNPRAYDARFQHGGRAPATSARCQRSPTDTRPAPWKCHRFRPDSTAAFVSTHVANGQPNEYASLQIASALAGQETALQCISIGGPQILIRHYAMIGYTSARAMYDAFQASERAHVAGFFDFCQYKLPRRRLLGYLRAEDWRNVARYYNGSGQVERYSTRISAAARDAGIVLRSRR